MSRPRARPNLPSVDAPYRAADPLRPPAPAFFTGRDASAPLWLLLAILAGAGVYLWELPALPLGVLVLAALADHVGRRFKLVVSPRGYHLTRYRFGWIPVARRWVSLDWDVCVDWGWERESEEPEGLTWTAHGPAPAADADGEPFWMRVGPAGAQAGALADRIRAAASTMRAAVGAR